MSEERKNQNTELNEAALEGVSGGESEWDWLMHATAMCARCEAGGTSRCKGNATMLARYMSEHNTCTCSCPFRE